MAIAVTDELQESVGPGTNRFVRALRAVCGRSTSFLQNIERVNVPWSAVWRGSRCSMDTNRCHRASGCALGPVEWRLPYQMNCRKVWVRALTGLCGPCVACLCQLGDLPVAFLQTIARVDVPCRPVEWRFS